MSPEIRLRIEHVLIIPSFSFLSLPLLTAHIAQQSLQLSYRIRAEFIQSIFTSVVSLGLRTEAPSTSADSSQAAVLVSVDTINVQACIEILFQCLTSFIIIGIGSYMLYRQIALAFLGSLALAFASASVPFWLGKQLQANQRASLQATEKRIEATNGVLLNPRAIRLEAMETLAFESIRVARKSEVHRTALHRSVEILVLLAGM